MTKKQMQARIAELETLVALLNAAVSALSASRTIYVGPGGPAQPTINPLPYTPFMPYSGGTVSPGL